MSVGEYTAERSYLGLRSIKVTGSGRLRYAFDQPLDRTVEVWFYDDGVSTFNIPMFGNLDTFVIAGGLNRAVSTSFYYYNDGAGSFVSTVPISTGWHVLQMYVNSAGSNAIIKIDGVQVFNGAISQTPAAMVELYNVGDTAYCDNIKVYNGAPAPVTPFLFQDDCENDIPTSKGWVGAVSYSTDITPHSGTRCIKLLGSSAYVDVGSIANRTLEVWFYDDGRQVTFQDNNNLICGLTTGMPFNFDELAPQAGVNWYNGAGGDTYYSYSPDWYFPRYAVSTVPRIAGWHLLQVYSDSTNTNGQILIDGTTVFNGAWDPLSIDAGGGKIWLGSLSGDDPYFDDLRLYEGQPRSFTANLREGLVAYYKLNDHQDELSVHDATLNGSPTFVLGKIGNGMQVTNGGTDYAEISLPQYTNTKSWTQSCWYKVTSWQHVGYGLFGMDGGPSYGAFIFMEDNVSGNQRGIRCYCGFANTDQSIIAPSQPTLNDWHHIAAGFDAMANKFYVWFDGAKQEMTINFPPNSWVQRGNRALIGGFPGFGKPGVYDEAAFWNRLLTDAEVAALYNAGAGSQFPFN
jgi:hypothetical protein